MIEPSQEIKERLLYILHRGFVETRLLGGAGKNKQVADLADAMELIPGMLKNWHEDDLEKVKSLLQTYQNKYPEWRFDFVSRLEKKAPLAF